MTLRLLLVVALGFCCIGILWAGDQNTDQDTNTVLQANEAFYTALNAMFEGDLKPMIEVWSHANDVVYLPPDGSFNVGWEATKKDWKMQADKKLGGTVKPESIHVTVGRDLAVVRNYELGNNVVDGVAVKVKIRATNVYRKEDGRWKMIGHHTDKLPFLEQ